MDIYEKNLKTIGKYYPNMDQLIIDASKDMKSDVELQTEYAWNGEKILCVKKGGRTLYLESKRGAGEMAHMWYHYRGEKSKGAVYVIVGMGNLSYLKEIVENTEERMAILIYEPCLPIFLHALGEIDLEPIMEKHTLIFWVDGVEGSEDEHISRAIGSLITYDRVHLYRNLVLPNYDELFMEKVHHFLKLCGDALRQNIIRVNANAEFTNVVVDNVLNNAKYLCDGYNITQLVKVIPRDIPGIVVAAGPSLNKNIQELKRAQGRAFIVAVDTAIKPLLKAGIKPDMFAVIDPTKPLHLIEMPEVKGIPMMANISAAKELLNYQTGKKFFYGEGFGFVDRILLRSGTMFGSVETGGSVATTVFSMLYKIGIDRIILVGQDLAFTGNKSHADGTFAEVMEENTEDAPLMVPGNYEEKVPTSRNLKLYCDWYKKYIADCKKWQHREHFHVMNATEGGAKIEGTEILTLKEAIDRECTKEVDIEACLNQLSPMLSEENRAWCVEFLKCIPDNFNLVKEKARKLKRLYKKLDKICVTKKVDEKAYLSVLKKIEKEQNDLGNVGVYDLISYTLVAAQVLMRMENLNTYKTIQEEGKEIAKKGILYMQLVEECATLFEEVSKEYYQELE